LGVWLEYQRDLNTSLFVRSEERDAASTARAIASARRHSLTGRYRVMTLPPLSSAERGRPCRPHERKGPAFTFATSRVGLECCDTSAARSRRPSRRCWAAALPRAAGRIDARAPAGAHLRLGRQFSADAAAPAHQLPASVFRTLFLRPRCKSLWRRGFATPTDTSPT